MKQRRKSLKKYEWIFGEKSPTFYFVIQVPSLISQTEKYVHDETSDRARKLEIKEFSNANFLPLVCENKDECSPDKKASEESDLDPEEVSTTESIMDLKEENSDESEDTEADQTESPDLEMTTEFVEEFQAQIPAMKELGEELLPYQGVVYYPEENEVEQTTAIFIPQDDKEFLEVLPTKEPSPDFKFNLSLETTTEVSDYYQEYQEEETTVTPGLMENENKSKIIFPFVATSYTSSIPIVTYGL